MERDVKTIPILNLRLLFPNHGEFKTYHGKSWNLYSVACYINLNIKSKC